MDPLSVAASVAGLVGLVGGLVQLTSQFITGVRHAKDGAQSMIDELNALQSTLQKLQDFLTSRDPKSLSFGDTSLLYSHSKALTTKLGVLHKTLEHASQSKIRRLAWPISQKDYLEAINSIRAFSHLVHFALSIDTCTLLSRTSDEIVETLTQQIKGLKLLDSIEARIAPLEQAVNGQTLILEAARRRTERANLLHWLADDAQEKQHERIKKTRVSGTGQWLLRHDEFLNWTDQSEGSNMLWCPGEMGSGKTNLASLVIDERRNHNDDGKNAMGFFYFSYAETQRHSMNYILESLIRQLLANPERPIPQSLLQLHGKHENGTSPSAKDLQAALLEIVDEFEIVYLVFDALDEMDATETRGPFLRFLKTLKGLSKLRLFVTSRPHCQDIHATFENSVTINVKADEDDVRSFIRSQVDYANSPDLLDDTFGAEISDQLVQEAQGLFLLPALKLKRVLQEPTRGDMRDALRDLPSSLAGVLDDNVRRIFRQTASRRCLALNALMWLCHARMPLSAGEFPDIVSFDLTRKHALDENYRPSARVIVECCQGLVFLDEATDTFHLVHLAVQEHLLNRELQIFGDSTARLVAKTCLLYFLDPAFDQGPALLQKDLSKDAIEEITYQEILKFLQHHSFFAYLSHSWGWHARECPTDPEVRSLLMRFLDSRARVARATQLYRFTSGFRGRYWDGREAWSVNGVHLASEFGLTELACELIDTGKAEVDYPSRIGTTALIKAASSDQLDTLRELLRRGADPYNANWYGNSLHCAAEANCVLTLHELLDFGVDPNALAPNGRTALSCTIDKDCVEAAEMLLQHGASMKYPAVPGSANLKAWRRSFLREILKFRSTKLLKMVVRGGYVASEDATEVIRRMVQTGRLAEEDGEELAQYVRLHCDDAESIHIHC